MEKRFADLKNTFLEIMAVVVEVLDKKLKIFSGLKQEL